MIKYRCNKCGNEIGAKKGLYIVCRHGNNSRLKAIQMVEVKKSKKEI